MNIVHLSVQGHLGIQLNGRINLWNRFQRARNKWNSFKAEFRSFSRSTKGSTAHSAIGVSFFYGIHAIHPGPLFSGQGLQWMCSYWTS